MALFVHCHLCTEEFPHLPCVFNALDNCSQMYDHRAQQMHGGTIPQLLTAGWPSGFQLSTAVNLIMVSGRDLYIYINHLVIFQENGCLGAWIVECGFRMFLMAGAQPRASLYECLPTRRETGVGEKESTCLGCCRQRQGNRHMMAVNTQGLVKGYSLCSAGEAVCI